MSKSMYAVYSVVATVITVVAICLLVPDSGEKFFMIGFAIAVLLGSRWLVSKCK